MGARVCVEARVTNVPVHAGTRRVIYCLVRAVIYRVLINLILRMKYDNKSLFKNILIFVFVKIIIIIKINV